MKQASRQLWFWVLVAIAAGAAFGFAAPAAAKEAKWLADAFLQLVKTITAPVIFLTVVVGITSLGSMARAGGLAARALGYFFTATVVALGLIAVTAARDQESIRRAIAHGVVQYLVKPFAFATFADKLERYARYRQQVECAAEPDQAGVDALLGTLRGSSHQRTLPKGLNATTLEHVRNVLSDAGGEPLTASEVAGRCGLSRVTARRYLEHLAVDGTVHLSMRYGGTGRPEHLYAWPARG